VALPAAADDHPLSENEARVAGFISSALAEMRFTRKIIDGVKLKNRPLIKVIRFLLLAKLKLPSPPPRQLFDCQFATNGDAFILDLNNQAIILLT